MDEVHAIDVTGLVALESAVATLAKRRCTAVLVGLRIQPRNLLVRAGLTKRSNVVLCDDMGEADRGGRRAGRLQGRRVAPRGTDPSAPAATGAAPRP